MRNVPNLVNQIFIFLAAVIQITVSAKISDSQTLKYLTADQRQD